MSATLFLFHIYFIKTHLNQSLLIFERFYRKPHQVVLTKIERVHIINVMFLSINELLILLG